MSGTSKEVEEAIRKCDVILKELNEPFAIFVFEEVGCTISDGFCCSYHMKLNVLGLLNSYDMEQSH